MFELDGHVRHFFSKKYAEDVISQAGLRVKDIVTGKEEIYGKVSGFVRAAAIK